MAGPGATGGHAPRRGQGSGAGAAGLRAGRRWPCEGRRTQPGFWVTLGPRRGKAERGA